MIESQNAFTLPSAAVRRRLRTALASRLPAASRADDVRLFAVTFVAGFLFFSIFLA